MVFSARMAGSVVMLPQNSRRARPRDEAAVGLCRKGVVVRATSSHILDVTPAHACCLIPQ